MGRTRGNIAVDCADVAAQTLSAEHVTLPQSMLEDDLDAPRTVTILGIDPSTKKVGWCVMRGDMRNIQSSLKYEQSGTIDLGKHLKECPYFVSQFWGEGDDAWMRLENLPVLITNLCVEWMDGQGRYITACEMPMPSHGNKKTDRQMGAAFGIVLAISTMLCEFMSVSPHDVKATPYHKSNNLSMAAAAQFAGKKSVEKDEADAIGVAYAAAMKLKELECLKNH